MENEPISLLIIEDNPVDAGLVQAMLKAGPGRYEIARAGSLSAGLKSLVQVRPAIILLDLGLPDSQGLDALDKVHALSPPTPIVVMTGLDDASVGLAAISRGAQDYLVKGAFDGKILGRVINFALERKKAEIQLLESEQKYLSLIENIPMGVSIVQNGKIIFTNPGMEKITGYSPDELLSLDGFELIHPADRARVRKYYAARIQSGKGPDSYSLRIKTRDGSIRWLDRLVVSMAWHNEPAVLVLDNDITERKKVEDALRDSETQFRDLFNGMINGAAIYKAVDNGADFVFMDFNPAAEKIEKLTSLKKEMAVVKIVSGLLLAVFLLILVFPVPVLAADIVNIDCTNGNDTVTYGVGSTPGNGSVTGAAPVVIYLNGISGLEINALSGNDTVTLDNPDPQATLETIVVNGGPGNDTFNLLHVEVALSGNVTFNGDDGDDIFNISPSTSAVVNVDGGVGFDVLYVDAQGALASMEGPSIVFGPGSGYQTVYFTNVNIAILFNFAVPDLSIVKTADSASINAGDTAAYTITVHNAGGASADGVMVTDPLPAGIAWTTNTSGASITGGVLTDTIGTLAAGASEVIYVSGNTTSANAGTLTNTATVTSTGNFPVSLNSTAEILVNAPDLSIVKTADSAIVNSGGTAAFTITVHNSGPGAAYNVAVNDPLPSGINWTTSTPGASITGGVLTDAIGTLAAGAAKVIHVSGPAGSANAGTLTNTATVNSSNNDPVSLNSTAAITVLVPNIVDLKTVELVNDADSDGVPSEGDTLKYTCVIKNTGHAAAAGVKFSDTPDPNTMLFSDTVKTTRGSILQGNGSGDKSVCISLGTIPVNGTVMITFEVLVGNRVSPLISNQALIEGSNFAAVLSDDPHTAAPNDPTDIVIKIIPGLPAISQPGIIMVAMLMGGILAWMIRRRQIGRGLR
jgi:PAS domain S-box-containing protein/uncharacterized repeat protein (TIGR01451 family)